MVLPARVLSVESWMVYPTRQRRYALKLLVIGLALLTANGALFFHERYSYNGFFYATRLPALITANMSHVNMFFYQSFPTSPFYVLGLRQITGLDVESIIYLPIFPVISLLWYFILARLAFQNDLLGVLMAISVVAFFGGKLVHYTEYSTGLLAYPLFLFVGYKLLTTGRARYVALLATLMILLWGFAPHGQVRAVSFIFISAAIFALYRYRTDSSHTTSRRTDGGKQMRASLKMLPRQIMIIALAGAAFLFWFTGKFYTGFVGRLDTAFTSPLAPIARFLFGIVSPTRAAVLKYGESPHLPELAQTVDTIYMFLTGVVLALTGLLVIFLLFFAKRDYLRNSIHELILAVGVASYLPDMMFMLLSGRLQLAIIRELGAILTLGILLSTVKRLDSSMVKQILHIGIVSVVVVFFVLGIASQVAFLATDAPTGTPSDAQTETTGAWIHQYGVEEQILSDLNSIGYVRTAIAEITNNPRQPSLVRYSDTRYAYLIGDNVSAATPTPEFQKKFGTPKPPERFGYILLNWATPSEPLKRGSPDWRSFESIGEHKTEIRTNHRINRIFATGQYTVERPVKKD